LLTPYQNFMTLMQEGKDKRELLKKPEVKQ
jgi:hypothetical protein